MFKFLFLIPLFILDLLLFFVWAILSSLFWKDFLETEDSDPPFYYVNIF